jgi:hypothetical protein
MKPLALISILLASLTLAACNGSGGGNGGQSAQTRFSSFVADLFSGTSDTAEPVAINDRDFAFPDENDETAFASLL